jgi:hypothetical protein
MKYWRIQDLNLCPSLKKSKFTPEEDKMILHHVNEFGSSNWKPIALKLKRTKYDVTSHFWKHLNPDINNGEWTHDQEIKLLQLYVQYGSKWTAFREYVDYKSAKNIKNKFFDIISEEMELKMGGGAELGKLYPKSRCITMETEEIQAHIPDLLQQKMIRKERQDAEEIFKQKIETPDVGNLVIDCLFANESVKIEQESKEVNSSHISKIKLQFQWKNSNPSLLRSSQPSKPALLFLAKLSQLPALNQFSK